MTAYETKARTALRSLIWRVFGILLTIFLALAFGGDLKLAIELGITYNAIRLVTHYFHDRIWAHIQWGIEPPPLTVEYRYHKEHRFPGEDSP